MRETNAFDISKHLNSLEKDNHLYTYVSWDRASIQKV